MKPTWRDGVFFVELHVPDRNILLKARDIGRGLKLMAQPDGQALIDACNKLLNEEEPNAPSEN